MATEISTEGLGQPVKVGAIDGELKKLWEADEASTNASLMNFLVYTEDPTQLANNSETIQELTREHACRAVLIAMDRKASEASIESWITAHCHLAHGKKSICSEQLSFLLRGKSVGRLRNTVFAHLNSDLPLVFWWQNEISDLFEERLYRLLDRLIFDSSTWEDPKAGFAKICAAREDTGSQMVTQDLAWTRSFYFRLAIAGLMEDPAAQQAFSGVQKVKLVARQGQRTSALLLLSWVAKLAGWKTLEKDTNQFTFEAKNGQKIEASVNYEDEGPALAEISIEAPEFKLRVTCQSGKPHLWHSLCVGSHCVDFNGPVDAEKPAELVASQLARGGKNSLFLKVLPQFLEIL